MEALGIVSLAILFLLRLRKQWEPRQFLMRNPRRPLRDRLDFWKEFRYLTNRDFRKNYRMSKPTFRLLLRKVAPSLEPALHGRIPSNFRLTPYYLGTGLKLSMALRHLAGGAFVDIGRIHGCSETVARTSFWSVLKIINADDSIGAFDFDPQNVEYLQAKCDLFGNARPHQNLLAPSVIGAVDGLAVKIKNPARYVSNPTDYVNRKSNFSINCQALCDANRRFLLFTCTSPGSTHDSAAFALSFAEFPQFVDGFHLGDDMRECFIVGDNAYPVTAGILTPFPGRSLVQYRDSFNFQLSSCRCVIECAFGMLVQRWGILWRDLEFEPSKCCLVIHGCAKLHNFIIDNEGKKKARSIVSSAHQEYRQHVQFQHEVSTSPPIAGVNGPSLGLAVANTKGNEIRDYFVARLQELGIERPKRRDN